MDSGHHIGWITILSREQCNIYSEINELPSLGFVGVVVLLVDLV